MNRNFIYGLMVGTFFGNWFSNVYIMGRTHHQAIIIGILAAVSVAVIYLVMLSIVNWSKG